MSLCPAILAALAAPVRGPMLGAITVTAPVLSGVLITIGAILLIGLALTYRARQRDVQPPRTAEGRRELEEFLADARELSERLAANLDAKAARLERLIGQADERLGRLERHTEARPRQEARQHAPPDDTGPLNRRIYDLADRGLPPVEIAKQLSQQVGQVELILALRRG
jgi:hypothetical protein